MALQLLHQALILMILVLIYLTGGYIAGQTKDELKMFKSYVRALVAISAACIVGLIVFNVSNIYVGIAAGIIVFILSKLIQKYVFYFIIIILTGAIIFQSMNILGAAVVMVLMQGIMDYSSLKKASKSSKKKSKKEKPGGKYDAFLIKVIQVIIIPLVILVIYGLVT